MSSVIVFSKDRPMQLHGYLESLIWASGCSEEQIFVLYREVLPISYDKVKSYFPNVHWIAEVNFGQQLQTIIDASDEYIMFGCDDVLFMDTFDLQEMQAYLADHDDVVGFSLRLGANITPLPKKTQKDGKYFTWRWTQATGHYGYPWELDCTLYRKKDVQGIARKMGLENVKSPNYFEAIPEEKPEEYISRDRLAAYYERSKAIVITVNRVQETHLNKVDDSKITDVLSLFIKYHYEDRFLDLENLRKKTYTKVHVGSEYFQLTASDVVENRAVDNKKWRNLFQNLRILASGNLETAFRKYQKDSIVHAELGPMISCKRNTKVLNPEETVKTLSEMPKSFCRFGDGEFMLMLGRSIGFQNYDPILALKLWQIFQKGTQNIYVGVPYQQFQTPDDFNQWIKEFYYTSGRWVRNFLSRYLSRDRELYIDTGFNQVYQTYANMNFAAYYEAVRKLFERKKLTLVVGKDILSNLDYNIFDLAESIEYIYGPTKDAYSKYNEILEEALKTDKDRLICVILGPTSKVLVYDLTEHGYIAWDIGHLAKDYDAYRKRISRTKEQIGRFYAPD